MKKILKLIFPMMLFFALSIPAYAAGTVSTVTAEATRTKIEVSGTTSGVTAAVVIQVIDNDDQIVAMDSFVVLNDAFSGEMSGLTLTEGNTYSVRAADYDGGAWTTISSTVPVSVASVALNTTSGTLTTAGGTLQLTATISPANASNQNVTWSTSNASVATVDATGKVTARGNGTAFIKVTTEDGNKTAAATITVAINSNTEDDEDSQDTSDDSSDNQSTVANTSAKEETVNVPIEYIVVKGDTLGKIARLNHMSLSQLLAMNPQIKNPNLIRIGQKIIVGNTSKVVTSQTTTTTTTKSDATFYIVKKGDSLYKIAKLHNMTYTKLIALNPDVLGRKYIYPGQKIRVK